MNYSDHYELSQAETEYWREYHKRSLPWIDKMTTNEKQEYALRSIYDILLKQMDEAFEDSAKEAVFDDLFDILRCYYDNQYS